jgi:dTDP-4-dehydrorhamnose 3,5-epimerase
MLIIPEGCAHEFEVLESGSELLYLHTAFYNLDSKGGVLYDDPQIEISLPLPITDLSERDKKHLLLP